MQKPGSKKMDAKTCLLSISPDEKSLRFQPKV
jgi:hypothetical protein